MENIANIKEEIMNYWGNIFNYEMRILSIIVGRIKPISADLHHFRLEYDTNSIYWKRLYYDGEWMGTFKYRVEQNLIDGKISIKHTFEATPTFEKLIKENYGDDICEKATDITFGHKPF